MGHNHADISKPKPLMHIQPNIGLDSDARCSIVEILNKTLSNETVLTVKTRSAHWNVRGAGFFELHTLFESQYTQLNDISNDIAERVRMLGGVVIGSLKKFIEHTSLEELPEDIPEIINLLADHEASICFLREDARKCSEEYEDEVSRNFLVDILRKHEKMAWMLRAYIEPELTGEKN